MSEMLSFRVFHCVSNFDITAYTDSDTEIEDVTAEMTKVVSEQVQYC